MLSHTWVRYQGFLGHGIKCPILTTVVPGFFGDLIGCTIRSKWGPFGYLYLARKNISCVWNKLFLVEIKLSQRRTRPVKYLLSGWKNTNGYPNKVWDKSKTTWAVGIVQLNSQLGPRWGGKNPSTPVSGFFPPPWTSWWVNCAIPTAYVVSL